MKIAVLSGKGGTGKTLISVNLASTFERAIYIDCDVEEPNGHLFFKPKDVDEKKICVKVPVVNHDKCRECRTCVEFCKFNALAFINQKVKVFDSICHACGGCSLFCPEHAIEEKNKMIGVIESGQSENVSVITGRLNTGEETGVPIIKELLKHNRSEDLNTVIDCPPGSSCMVMESIKDSDYCVLVAEPTIFGSHNLNMVYELVQMFDKPFGCVLNKCIDGENPSETFCLEHKIPIIGRFLFDKDLGEINSNGGIISRANSMYFDMFKALQDRIREEVHR